MFSHEVSCIAPRCPQSEDYKEYMSSGEGSKLFETKIHRQHVEFLARFFIKNGLGGANCGLYVFALGLYVHGIARIRIYIYMYAVRVLFFTCTWTCAYIPVLVVTVVGWTRNPQQNIFNHPWNGPISSHIPLDNGTNYQPQLVSRIPSINRMSEFWRIKGINFAPCLLCKMMQHLRYLPPTFQKCSTAKTTRKFRWQCKSTIWRCIHCKKNADFPAKLVFRGVLLGVGLPATIFWQEGKTFLLHLEWQLDSQWTCGIVSRGKCG